MNKRKRITAAAVAVILIICLVSASAAETFVSETGYYSDNMSEDILPSYYHYEPESFYQRCDEMKELYAEGKLDEAWALYNELYDEYKEVNDLFVCAELKNNEDVNDEYYADEFVYIENTKTEVCNYFKSCCSAFCSGKYAEEFRSFLGNDELFENFLNYDEIPDELSELLNKEQEMIIEYMQLNNSVQDYVYVEDGTDYTYDFFISEQSDELYYDDQERYYDLFSSWYDSAYMEIKELYAEIVSLRKQIALLSGYDNYADYAYDYSYNRSYSYNDLEALRTVIRKYGSDIEDFNSFLSMYNSYDADTEEIISEVQSAVSEISELAAIDFEHLLDNSLLSIGSESSRTQGAYCEDLLQAEDALICVKSEGNLYDFDTLAHEFGHYVGFTSNPNKEPLFQKIDLDIAEIHSTGLEIMFAEKFGTDMLGDLGDYYRALIVSSYLDSLVAGCCIDEWETQIYTSDHEMTVEEIDALYEEISAEYGYEGSWYLIPHVFSSPVYYISYAVSSLASLQIWDVYRKDSSEAADIWESIIYTDFYHVGYVDAVKNAGLSGLDDQESIENIISEAIEFMEEVYQEYYW